MKLNRLSVKTMYSLVRTFSQIRNISKKTKKIVTKSKADIVKQLNYENKALFGAVGKRENGQIDGIPEPENEHEYSSEMYWLLDYKHKKDDKIDLNANEYKTKRRSSASPKLKSIGDSLKALRPKRVKNLHPQKINDIPFGDKDLRNILKFPLFGANDQNIFKDLQKLETNSYPSVGKILQATMPENARKALQKWKLTKITELGEEGFNEMQKKQLQDGKEFHLALQTYLTSGILPENSSPVYTVWQSIFPVLDSLKPELKFAEQFVEHPFLMYRGIVDCVSNVGSDLSVIEWKKSDKRKDKIEQTYDAPLQMVAYLGALKADPKYNLIAKKGYVIVAYTDGEIAKIHQLDQINLQKYWKIWLQRVQEFWIRTRDGTLPEPI